MCPSCSPYRWKPWTEPGKRKSNREPRPPSGAPAALLWGGDDLALTLGLGVQAGLDTDSATATIGSVIGAVHGAAALPSHLVEPLSDRISSAVRGYDNSRISELAGRTFELIEPQQAGANV